MSIAELNLLAQRLRDMADTHEHYEEEDGAADTADAMSNAAAREPVLCVDLLLEAIQALASC